MGLPFVFSEGEARRKNQPSWGNGWMCLLSDPALKAATLGQTADQALETLRTMFRGWATSIAFRLGMKDPDVAEMLATDTISLFATGEITFEYDPSRGKPLSFVRTLLWRQGCKLARTNSRRRPIEPLLDELCDSANPVELACCAEAVAEVRDVVAGLTEPEVELLAKRFGTLLGRTPSGTRWTQREYERLSRLLDWLEGQLRKYAA